MKQLTINNNILYNEVLTGRVLNRHHRNSGNGKTAEGLESPKRFYCNRLLIMDDYT